MTAPRKQAPEDGLTSPSFGACLLIRGGLELDFFKDLVVHPVRIFHLAWAGFLQGFVVVCGGRQPTGDVRLAQQKSFSKRNLHFLTWWTTMVCLKIVNTPRPHAFFQLIGGFHLLVKSPLTCPLRRDCPKSRPPPQPLDWLRRRRLQGGRAHCTGSARRGIRHPSPGLSPPGPSPAAVQRAGPHPGSCPRLPSPPAGTPGWCAGCTGSCAR